MPDFSVRRGTAIFGASGPGPVSTTVPVSPAADPTRAFPRLTTSLLASAGRDVADAATLGNVHLGALLDAWTGAAFDLERNTGAELRDHRHFWEVVEDTLPADMRPFHGLFLRTLDDERMVGGVGTVTTGAVPGLGNLTQCLVWPLAVRSDAATPSRSNTACTAFLDGLGQVQIDRGGTTGNCTLSFVVAELGLAWRVRRVTAVVSTPGEHVVTGAGADPWSRKFLIASWRSTAGANNLAESPVFRAGANADEVRVQYPSAATGTFTVSVYVVSHTLLRVLHRTSYGGTSELAAGQTDAVVPLGSDPFDPATTSVIAYTEHDAANTNYPINHWGYTLAGDGLSVQFRHGRTASRASDYALQVVSWPTVPRGLGRSGFGGSYFSGRRE